MCHNHWTLFRWMRPINFVKNLWRRNVWSNGMEKFLLLLVPQIWPRCWDEKEENIDRTEAWCGSAAVGNHGSLAGEDRALSCRSFYVSCYPHFIQLVVALVFWWVSLVFANQSPISPVLGECGVSNSQGELKGEIKLCLPFLFICPEGTTSHDVLLPLSFCNPSLIASVLVLFLVWGDGLLWMHCPQTHTIIDDRRDLTVVCAYHAICLFFDRRDLTFACAHHAIVFSFDCCLSLLLRSIEGECIAQHENEFQSVKRKGLALSLTGLCSSHADWSNGKPNG